MWPLGHRRRVRAKRACHRGLGVTKRTDGRLLRAVRRRMRRPPLVLEDRRKVSRGNTASDGASPLDNCRNRCAAEVFRVVPDSEVAQHCQLAYIGAAQEA